MTPRERLQGSVGRQVFDSTRGPGDVFYHGAQGVVQHFWSEGELEEVLEWWLGRSSGEGSARTRALGQLCSALALPVMASPLGGRWLEEDSSSPRSAEARHLLVRLEWLQSAHGTPRFQSVLPNALTAFNHFYETTALAGADRHLLPLAERISRALDAALQD